MINEMFMPIPEHLTLACLAAFPERNWGGWHHYESGKQATRPCPELPNACHIALEALGASVSPPHGSFWDYEYHGSGLHYMPPGSRLGRHVDAEYHPTKPWRRTSSLVLFLNRFCGGDLIVGNQEFSCSENRAFMFSSSIPHEVTEVIQGARKSISLFSYEIDHGPKGSTRATFEQDRH